MNKMSQLLQDCHVTESPQVSLYHQSPTIKNPKKRATERVSHILKTLPPDVKIISVADIGAGNAEITDEIAKRLNVSQAYAADIYSIDEFIKPSPNSIVQYVRIIDEKLPLQDNSIDLVTAFVVIHHINFPAMLNEIRRVLKTEGFLFIREHDVSNDSQVKYLDEIHEKFEENSNTKIHYWSRKDLTNFIVQNGFQKIADSDYIGKNPQSIYHSMYKYMGPEIKT